MSIVNKKQRAILALHGYELLRVVPSTGRGKKTAEVWSKGVNKEKIFATEFKVESYFKYYKNTERVKNLVKTLTDYANEIPK